MHADALVERVHPSIGTTLGRRPNLGFGSLRTESPLVYGAHFFDEPIKLYERFLDELSRVAAAVWPRRRPPQRTVTAPRHDNRRDTPPQRHPMPPTCQNGPEGSRMSLSHLIDGLLGRVAPMRVV